ncbi:response regulator [Ferruginibacter sp.]|nr:DNA-binding response regulator [Ferruginibacter sp.]
MMENPTVLIVEDELITAVSIEELLQEEDYNIIGIARDAVTALRLCNQAAAPPAVVICDINIKGTVQGTELAGQLKELYGCEIIFLTAYADAKTLQAAFTKDPVMYVVKPYTDVQVLVALQMAFHKIYNKEKTFVQNGLDLTEREKEIALLVAQGMSSKQVARKLTISIETVKTHRRRMLQKNNISSFPHLVYLMNKEA